VRYIGGESENEREGRVKEYLRDTMPSSSLSSRLDESERNSSVSAMEGVKTSAHEVPLLFESILFFERFKYAKWLSLPMLSGTHLDSEEERRGRR